MNPVISVLMNRRSVRAYAERKISRNVKDEILAAAMRAPTAGNMMLYSIIEVQDQTIKDALVKTCDNQDFIARAPWVLLFLSDYQRWYDYFLVSGVAPLCEQRNIPMRKPEEGDMFLASCDALIAAQTAVIAAESLGIGSCYIGDITEHYEVHKKLFCLPQYVVPICLVCFGYPAVDQKKREQTGRFDREFVVFENRYRRLDQNGFKKMFEARQQQAFRESETVEGTSNFGQLTYSRKFDVDYAKERNRSVREILKAWRK